MSMNTRTEVQQASQQKFSSNKAMASDEEVNLIAKEITMLEDATMTYPRRKKGAKQSDSSKNTPLFRPEKLQLDHMF